MTSIENVENIEKINIYVNIMQPAPRLSLLDVLARGELVRGAAEQTSVVSNRQKRYKIGEYVEGEGGYFAGDIRGDDGRIYGLIDAGKDATVRGAWGANGELKGLSDWDGLTNTIALRKRGCPVADLCAKYERDGHTDFYLPAQRELIIARANLPHLYEKAWHWTSTPYGAGHAWAVDVEDGDVGIDGRCSEFLARPFRRLIY